MEKRRTAVCERNTENMVKNGVEVDWIDQKGRERRGVVSELPNIWFDDLKLIFNIQIFDCLISGDFRFVGLVYLYFIPKTDYWFHQDVKWGYWCRKDCMED